MDFLNAIKTISAHSRPHFEELWTRGQQLERDWFHKNYPQRPKFLCAVDRSHFHFLAGGLDLPLSHPESAPGKFQPELWKYDVAEFFLAAPDGSSYLEFNLSPNAAWWSARFAKPRAALDQPPLAGVETLSETSEGRWQACASIPLSELGPLEGALLNVTFILGSPEQRFFTAAPPAEGAPDFHRPDLFLPISLPSDGDARQTAP